jgi:hypothetical protein
MGTQVALTSISVPSLSKRTPAMVIAAASG